MKFTLMYSMILITTFVFGQSPTMTKVSNTTGKEIRMDGMTIHVNVDSAAEVASIFNSEDVISILEQGRPDEPISFKITCRSKAMMNDDDSKMTFAVTGVRGDKKRIITSIESMKKTAIKYYKNN